MEAVFFFYRSSRPRSRGRSRRVVENGRVIVGDGIVLERGSVIVAADRVLSVSEEPVDLPGVRRIDASGKTVLPGLIDAHVHLLVEDLTSLPRNDGELEAYVREGLPERLRAYLHAGITTVVSTGDYWPAIRGVRDRIRAGELTGPRVFTSGPVFTAPGGHPAVTVCGRPGEERHNPWCRDHLAVEVESPRHARESVDRLAEGGADFVKMVFDSISPPDVEQLEPDLVGVIVRAAHRNGLRAYAHINQTSNAIEAIGAGLDGLVHVPFMATGPNQRKKLAASLHEEGVTAATTSVTMEALRRRFAREGDDRLADRFRENLAGRYRTIARSAEAGDALLAIGTDAPQLPPGEAYHGEIRLAREAGLTPDQIVKMATRNAAVHLGMSDELGTLEAGKLADLIVVDGNPLDDLQALKNVELVVKGGEVLVDHSSRRSGRRKEISWRPDVRKRGPVR